MVHWATDALPHAYVAGFVIDDPGTLTFVTVSDSALAFGTLLNVGCSHVSLSSQTAVIS
ncbi:Uncharacterised protein [Mycobacteroides abscessus subsp. bolletii]|nr:Uncharacterised protein [Mycobacteroides abscessus subsp. bolletii]